MPEQKRTITIPATFKVEPLEPINEEQPSILSALRKKQQILDEQNPSFLRELVSTEQIVVGIEEQWVSKDIVGVQPMEGPVGLVCTLSYRPINDTEDKETEFQQLCLEVCGETVEAGSLRYEFNNSYIDIDKVVDELSTSNESTHLAEFIDGAANEIDAEIVGDLRKIATKQSITLNDRKNNTAVVCNYAANEIGRETRRGAGNRFIFGKKAFEKFTESTGVGTIEGLFELDTTKFDDKHALRQVGVSWRHDDSEPTGKRIYQWLYTSNVLEDNEILVAYKGSNGEVDCNYIYCPYVMVAGGGDAVNPHNFRPAAGGISRRYGKTFSDSGKFRSKDGKSTYHQLITLEDL
jgi:hypothetical protein